MVNLDAKNHQFNWLCAKVKAFECGICDKPCKSQDALNKHRIKYHADHKEFLVKRGRPAKMGTEASDELDNSKNIEKKRERKSAAKETMVMSVQ